MATAAAGLQSRWPEMPSELADLSEEQWRDLFVTAKSQFKPQKPYEELVESKARLLVDAFKTQIKALHARALVRPESTPVTFIFLVVYLAVFLLTIVTATTTNLGPDVEKRLIRLQKQETAQ